MTEKFNPFHLVEKRPWPLIASFGALSLLGSGLSWVNKISSNLRLIVIALILITSIGWWRDVHREATVQGNHTTLVSNGLKTGMVLFILSEVLFFTSFFWAFFHRRISPTLELGQTWPPYQINSFNPIRVPLLNTILLLSSGVTVTWAHHEMLKRNLEKSRLSLILTVILGAVFTSFQAFEYIEAPFCIADSCFGSTFFIATGFHGIHVLIGSVFLIVSFFRLKNLAFSKNHIVGFECAAWYWHFVDVVWLFLYRILYWWGA